MAKKKRKTLIATLKSNMIGNLSADPYWRMGGECPDHSDVMKLFRKMGLEVPDDISTLWFYLHSTPGVNRIELSVKMVQVSADSYPELRYKSVEIRNDTACDKRLKPWVGKPVYLEVWYLEK